MHAAVPLLSLFLGDFTFMLAMLPGLVLNISTCRSGVKARLDPSDCGSVDISHWLSLAQNTFHEPISENEDKRSHLTSESGGQEIRDDGNEPGRTARKFPAAEAENWEQLVLIIWFALDRRETGELQTSRFVAWLRQIVAAPETPAVRQSNVYIMVNHGYVATLL